MLKIYLKNFVTFLPVVVVAVVAVVAAGFLFFVIGVESVYHSLFQIGRLRYP